MPLVTRRRSGAGLAVAAALDAWACVALPRREARPAEGALPGAGARARRAAALDDARRRPAVRGDDAEVALPALVDLSLSSSKPSKPVVVKSVGAFRDYDAPD